MATIPLQPGNAPANTITHEQAAKFLAGYQTTTGCAPFGHDAASCILNDLYGLTHILAIAFEEAQRVDGQSELLAINPRLLADGFRSIQNLVALAAFFVEAN